MFNEVLFLDYAQASAVCFIKKTVWPIDNMTEKVRRERVCVREEKQIVSMQNFP